MRAKRLWMRVVSVALIALVVMSLLPITAAASTFIEGTMPEDLIIKDDLILAGERVVLAGRVKGDAVCLGGEVLVTGEVEGSLIAFAANVTIRGEVKGSVYTGAQTVRLASGAKIGRNLYVGGFDLTQEAGAELARDLNFGGYQALIEGEIGETLRGGMASLDLNGRVGGDVEIEIAPPGAAPMMMTPNNAYAPPPARDMGLRVGDEAEVGGRLHYKSEVGQADAIAIEPEGGTVHEYVEPKETKRWGRDSDRDVPSGARGAVYMILRWMGKRLRDAISLAILAALALWLAPKWLESARVHLSEQPGPAAGYGALAWMGGFVVAGVALFVIIAIAVLLGIVTLGGLAWTWLGLGLSVLGLAFCLFMLAVTYVTKLIVAYWFGTLIFGKTYEGRPIWPLLVGVLIYVVLRGIPVIGWLLGLAATLFGMGALWLVVAEWLANRKETGKALEA